MAKKLTKKIRIKEYDVLNNEFKLTFQLAGYADDLAFAGVVNCNANVNIDYDAETDLLGLGFSDAEIDQMISELVQWLEKPRKHLGDNSHYYTMKTRFEVNERLKQGDLFKAEAERIIVASPPLDFAFSALDELEANAAVIENLESLTGHPAWEQSEPVVVVSGDVQVTATEAGEAKVASIGDAGLGERDSRDTSCEETDIAVRLLWAHHYREYSGITDREITEGTETIRKLTGDQSVKPWFYSTLENWGEQVSTPTLPTAAIDAAVDEIHIHMRRFLADKMSMREHNFIRSIIEEEIEKVVRGVL